MDSTSATRAFISDAVRLSNEMAAATNPGEVLAALVVGARGLLPFAAAALALNGEDGWRVWRAAARRKDVTLNDSIPDEAATTIERFLGHGQLLVIGDLLALPWSETSHRDLLWKDGTRSALLVPLIAGGTTLGALSFTSTRPDQYPPEGNEIASFLAWMVAATLRALPGQEPPL